MKNNLNRRTELWDNIKCLDGNGCAKCLKIYTVLSDSRWLTFDFHVHCVINRNTYSIVSCTSVCSIGTSLDITQDIFSIHHWKQRCTVCTITFYSRPTDVWWWFTSCITTQSNQRAFTNHLIFYRFGNSRGHCNNNFSKVTNLHYRSVSKGLFSWKNPYPVNSIPGDALLKDAILACATRSSLAGGSEWLSFHYMRLLRGKFLVQQPGSTGPCMTRSSMTFSCRRMCNVHRATIGNQIEFMALRSRPGITQKPSKPNNATRESSGACISGFNRFLWYSCVS